MKKKWIIIGLVTLVVAGGGFYGWKALKAPDVSAEDLKEERASFPTVAADVGEVKKTIFATGTVEAKEREEIKPSISGKVQQLLVQEGQHVNKGQALFTIDSDDASIEYQKQELNIARVNKELAQLKARKASIVADKAGKVKEVLVKEGEQVTEETVIAKLINTDYLKITGRFTAFEAERFKVGQQVQVFLPGSLSYLDATVSNVDLTGTNLDDSSGNDEKTLGAAASNKSIIINAPNTVEVLVKKQGALNVGELGVVQFTDPAGVLYASALSTPFELPDEIDLTAGTTGKIEKVLIKKDNVVNSNQLLIKMDTSNNELELREKELSLQESMLTLQQKKREIDKKQVVSPISGEITKLDIKEGDTVDPGKAAMTIMDSSSLYFKADVDEMDIPEVKTGQTVDVYVSAFGNQAFKGQVVEIPKEGTKDDKTVRFEVKIALENNGKMSHGMTGDCDINIFKKDKVTRLPASAIEVMEEGKGRVMIKDPKSGEPTSKEVEIGIEGPEFIEIKSGIAAGEEVVMMNGQG